MQLRSELIVLYPVPSLQNQDVMFAGVHSLRCQVIVPGTDGHYYKINTTDTVNYVTLGIAKYEHRCAPLYDVDGPHSRLIQGSLYIRILLLEDTAYVF